MRLRYMTLPTVRINNHCSNAWKTRRVLSSAKSVYKDAYINEKYNAVVFIDEQHEFVMEVMDEIILLKTRQLGRFSSYDALLEYFRLLVDYRVVLKGNWLMLEFPYKLAVSGDYGAQVEFMKFLAGCSQEGMR